MFKDCGPFIIMAIKEKVFNKIWDSKKIKKMNILKFFFFFLIKKIIKSIKDSRIPTGLSDEIIPQIKANIIRPPLFSSNK